MPIFLILNGLAVIFLLYVLVNFWKEGRRTKRTVTHRAADGERLRDFEPIIVTHPISQTAQGGLSVIPLRALAGQTRERPARRSAVNHRSIGVHHTVVEMPLSRISTNSASESLPRRARMAAKDGPRC